MPLKVLCSKECSLFAEGLYLGFATCLVEGAIPKSFGLLFGDNEDVTDPRFSKGLCEIPLCPNCDDSSSNSSLKSTSTSSSAG